MNSHRLSASGIDRGRHCLFWARGDKTWPEREPDEYTLYGTAWHGVAERTIDTGKACDPLEFAEALDDAATERLVATYEQWLPWWQKARGDLRWQAEVRVAWDVVTGHARLLPKTKNAREYGDLAPTEVAGTIDAVGEDAVRLEVIDWKSGYRPVESPRTNVQLAFYGAAIATAMGRDSARVNIAKPGPEAVVLYEPHDLDVISFAAIQAEVRDMLDRLPTSEPVAGPWCDYCPARGGCPATADQVAEVISAASIVRKHPFSLEVQSNDHAAWMLTAIDGVEDFLKSAKAKLREFADKNGGILLEDGTVWSAHSVHTEKPALDVPGALQALYALGLTGAVESRTTWAAIKRAGGAEGEKRARAELKRIGAIKASDHDRYEARPVKKGRAA